MSALAMPVMVTYTVTSTGQPAAVSTGTPMQVAVAQVHLGLKGDTGNIHPSMNGLVLMAKAAAEAAAESAAQVDLGALEQAVEDADAAKGLAENAAELATEKAGDAAASLAALTAIASSLLPCFAAAAALPGANQGPIWHDDYASVMTWRTIGAYTGYASVNLGEVAYFDASTPPPGWLECDGAVCAHAALNAYRGTNVLRDLRGEFIRGWDHGRGVDAGRVLGSAQADEFKAHSHNVPMYQGTAWTSALKPTTDATGTQNSTTTSSTGGAETRPRNVAMLTCIKF